MRTRECTVVFTHFNYFDKFVYARQIKKHWFNAHGFVPHLTNRSGQNATQVFTAKTKLFGMHDFSNASIQFASIGISKQYNARYEQASPLQVCLCIIVGILFIQDFPSL